MLNYYRENIQFYFILLFWMIVGSYAAPVSFGLVPLTMIMMWKKGMFEELLIGFFFILILSDSLEPGLVFAKDLKNVYIVMLAVFVFFDSASFSPFDQLYKIFIPFFLFSALTMLSSVSEPFFFTSVQKTISYAIFFIVIPNFVSRAFRDHGVEFLKRFIYFSFTTLLIGFILKYTAHDIAFLGAGRYRGVLGNPNGLGIYCFLIYIIFFVLNDYFPDLFSRSEKLIIYLSIFISIYLTDSRNATIAVLIFYVFQRFFSLSPFLGFIFFVIILVVSEIISKNLTSIVVSLGLSNFFRLNTLEDGSGRYVAWDFAWRQIQNNFFIGKGFAYNEYYMRQNYSLLQKLGHQGGIHNSFLTFWFDQGLVGLLIYLRSYILMFIKAARNTKFAFPILFSISFTAMFESWLVGSLSAFAFLSMIIFSIITSDEIKIVGGKGVEPFSDNALNYADQQI
jgi:O-antigen ligase